MATSMKKTILFDIDEDVEDFLPGRQVVNDYEDGNAIVDLFSRHNTLEEYMQLLNKTFKK